MTTEIVKTVQLVFHEAYAPYVTGDAAEEELGRAIAAGLFYEADVPAKRVIFLNVEADDLATPTQDREGGGE